MACHDLYDVWSCDDNSIRNIFLFMNVSFNAWDSWFN